jgi:hypothetical protein
MFDRTAVRRTPAHAEPVQSQSPRDGQQPSEVEPITAAAPLAASWDFGKIPLFSSARVSAGPPAGSAKGKLQAKVWRTRRTRFARPGKVQAAEV